MRAPNRQGFTGELWASAEATYAEILRHPFLTGLADGSLDVQAFRFYLIEDAYYLREFARALTITGAKAPKEEWIIRLNADSIGTL